MHARYPLTGPAAVSLRSPTGRIQPYDTIPSLQYRHYGRLDSLLRATTRLTPKRVGTSHILVMHHGIGSKPSIIPLFRHQSCYFRPSVIVEPVLHKLKTRGQRRGIGDIRSGNLQLEVSLPTTTLQSTVPPTLFRLSHQIRDNTRSATTSQAHHINCQSEA